MDRSLLDGEAQEMIPCLISDMLKMDDKYHDRVYSLAHSYDMRLKGVLDVMSSESKSKAAFNFSKALKFFSHQQADGSHEKGELTVKALKESLGGVPLNFIFALNSGDIGYTSLVKYPIRKHGVI